MRGARIFARLIGIICISGLIPPGAGAQELAGRIAGATTTMVQTPVTMRGRDSINTTSDSFAGRNANGPFCLSWKPIAKFSERVYVDGHDMLRELDYTIDYASSTVTFMEPVGNNKVVRIEYTFDPAKATQSKTTLNIPLTLDLMRNDNMGLQFVGLYKQIDPNKTGADVAVMGLAATTKMRDSVVNSMFLYNPTRSDSGTPDNSSFLDKAALKLGGETNAKNFTMKTSFTRVGRQFGASNDYGLKQGVQDIDISTAFTPSKALAVTSSYKKTDSVAGATPGPSNLSIINNILFNPSDTLKMALSRTETDTENPGTGVKSVADKMRIEQKIGKNGTALAVHEDTSVTTNGVEAKTSLNQLTLDTKPSDKMSVRGVLTQKDSTKDGKEQSVGLDVKAAASKTMNVEATANIGSTDRAGRDSRFGLNVQAAASKTINVGATFGYADTDASGKDSRMGMNIQAIASKTVSMTAALNHTDTDAAGQDNRMAFNVRAATSKTTTMTASINRGDSTSAGQDNSEGFTLVANPNKAIGLELNMLHKDADASGSEFDHAVKLVTNPRSDLRVELGMTGRISDRPVDEYTHTVKVATTAVKYTNVQVDWCDKDAQATGYETTGSVRLEATPSKKLKVSGTIGQRETSTSRDTSKEARLEANPIKNTTVGGGYKVVESNGSVVTKVTDVSTSTKPFDFLEFGGGYKNRVNAGQMDIDSLKFGLALKPGSILQLTGDYTTNPEDKKGVIQRMNSQSFGLSTQMGSFKLRGAYTLNDLYMASTWSQKTEVGMDLRLSQNAQLTTSYSEDDERQGNSLQTSVYALGYSHKVGSTFNLYFGGKMTTYLKDQGVTQKPDYEAEARMGLKF